jgi:hypothetical protein
MGHWSLTPARPLFWCKPATGSPIRRPVACTISAPLTRYNGCHRFDAPRQKRPISSINRESTMRRTTILVSVLAGLSFFQMSAAQASPVSGILTLNLTIYLGTAVPSGGTVQCGLSAVSTESGVENTEIASVAANVSGSTATCQVVIPYYWNLSTPNSDSIELSYSASIIPSGGLTSGTLRTGTHSLAPIVGVPPSGTHTAVSAETRL